MAQPISTDRQHLLDRLLDAVKQCQVRFGGRSELATDADSRVSCLCAQFEAVLQHGLKKPSHNPLTALQHMTGLSMPGISLMKSDTEQVYWPIVKDLLTPHEAQRYLALKHITTDAGRGRAWLRSTLNEHSLERYLHMVVGAQETLKQYYEPWAFLLDEERSTMLPTMARGLGSIIFAINIDNAELNGSKQPSTLTSLSTLIQAPETVKVENIQDKDPEPVILATAVTQGSKEKKKKKGKKKSAVSIVSFNDSEGSSTVPSYRTKFGDFGRNESTDSFDSSQSLTPSGEPGRFFVGPPRGVVPSQDSADTVLIKPGATTAFSAENASVTSSLLDRQVDSSCSVVTGSTPNSWSAETAPLAEADRVFASHGADITNNNTVVASISADVLTQDSTSTSEDLPVSFPATTPPSTPQETTILEEYQRIRNSVRNHEMEITRQQRAMVNGHVTPAAAASDATLDSRELYSAFPTKTPPPTPKEASTLAEYERLRNSVDASEVSDQLRNSVDGTGFSSQQCNSNMTEVQSNQQPNAVQVSSRLPNSVDSNQGRNNLQQDITISTPEGSTTRSIYDTFAAAQERVENGVEEEVIDEESSSSTKRTSVESSDRMSPALSKGSFHLLGEESDEAMFPVAPDEVQSTDSSVLAFGVEAENAAAGLALAQKGLSDSSVGELGRLEEMGKIDEKYQSMSSDDLRQALLANMNRNDELQEKNRSLRALLDSEMEHSASLRGQLEELKLKSQESEDKLDSQVQSLTRENELLKNQLKKYVAAVQMLRREGFTGSVEGLPGLRPDDVQPVIPEPSPDLVDYSEQAEQYEHKLIQVAEMHGELMEFNDYLSRQLKAKDSLIQRMRDELVDLRGPLPEDHSESEVNSPDSETASLAPATRALINLWIPSAFLRGKGKDAFHVYQIYIRIRDDEWNVYRRYSQFRELHIKMKKSHAVINTFEFPPKKAVGNKDTKFVEERRKKLQHYVRLVINYCVQNSLELTESPNKETLVSLIPFFGDSMMRKQSSRGNGGGTNKPRIMAGRRGPETPTYEGL